MKTARESSLGSEFRTGEWTVQPEACRIIRDNQQLRLRPMMMNLLVALAENAGQVLTKDRILETVWEASFVSESSLTREIAELRQVLGDNRKTPQYIETIPKRGYRYIAPVHPGQRRAEPRLAVLPFANLNKNPELDYFADGVSDALITELGSIGSLRVISRQSVLHFRNSDKDIAHIARELKVDVVVEGSVLNVGNRIRITAQLIQAEPEKHLWANNYDCEIGDVLEIQTRVAQSVANSIHAAMTPEDIARLSRKIPGDPEIHRAYLKARFLIMTWHQADMQTGFQWLNEVIQKDPGFAPAYNLMANCLFALGFWGYLPPRIVYPQARAAAVKAIELDERLSAAHATLGLSNLVMDWNPVACERELVRAIQLNPSSDFARMSYALFLVTVPGDFSKAMEQARLGLETDPLSEHMNFAYAWILFFAGEYELAGTHALKALKMYRDSLHLHFILGWSELGISRMEEAVRYFKKAAEISRDTISLGYLGYACGLAGLRDEAQAILRELTERSALEEIPLSSLAYLHIGLGDFDRAFECLEKFLDARDGRIFWFPPTVFSESFSADPRYNRLLDRMQAAVRKSVANS
jgi:TolB-like protein/Flp pilus assembly protein TadD